MKCNDCKFFILDKKNVYFKGECRRYPPVFNDSNWTADFPKVNEDDWCGEFKSK